MLGIIGALVIVFLVSALPESPKFLYANRRFDECRDVLKKIAKFNNASITNEQISNIVFDTEQRVNSITSLEDLTIQANPIKFER